MSALTMLSLITLVGLLWPLWRRTRRHGSALGRVSASVWRYQTTSAQRAVDPSRLAAFCHELEHDLPLREPERRGGSGRGVALVVGLAAIVVVLCAGGYVMTPRLAAVVAEQQRLADPLNNFTAAQQQERQLVRLQDKIRATPEDSVLWAELGEYYLYRNAYGNALLAYQRALALRGENPQLYSALATVLYYQAGQHITPGVQEMIDNALRLDDSEVTALMLLAGDAFMLANYQRAIALWQQVLDSNSPRVNRVQVIEAINMAKLLQNQQR
ncbi:heme lyase NrfEFG subunit NrfG [Entomohabitans teleogrylli]|uniref:heme lyase NrfEFG subunit NrfG n=1 Tax=Entomohabitans teleogrylli TaxID=1384589 RepID=UPI00073DA69B|nr:heme lyase NrfEFG subunit NrfG [Entomohabitans teleogrylli]